MKNRKEIFILTLIFVLFLLFRFYNLEKTVIFDWDQERDASVIKKILVEKRLTLIGPRVLGPEGFFLGPYFVYLLTPFYFFSGLHPWAITLFIIAYNLGFFTFAFYILRRLFGYPVTLIYLLIWSLHPGLIGIDRIAWNPLLVSLMVVISWALFSSAFKNPSFYRWLTVGFGVGLGINFHFQLIFLLPFGLVFWVLQRKSFIKSLIAFLGGMVFPFFPLLIFDLRHDFLNYKLLLDFFGEKEKMIDHYAWFPVWRNVSEYFTGLDFGLVPLGFYLLILVLVFWGWRKEKKLEIKSFFLAFLLLWLLFPLGFAAFGRRPSEYYFNFLYPFLVLILAYGLIKAIKKWWLAFLLVLLLFFLRVNQLKTVLQTNPLGLFYKDKVVQRIAEIGQEKRFNVSFSVPLGLDTGYRYLLEFYRVKQTGNPGDPLFQVVIPPQEDTENIGGIGLRIPKSFQQ